LLSTAFLGYFALHAGAAPLAKPTTGVASTRAAAGPKSVRKNLNKLGRPAQPKLAALPADVPENQPSARFKGHLAVVPRPRDPLPSWLSSAPKKLGVILAPDKNVPWMARSVFNASAVVKDGEVNLLVRVEDETGAGTWHGTSRIARARSSDGVHFKMDDKPVLEPTEWYESKGGTEDPRATPMMEDGYHYMTYTGYRYEDKTARLALARSKDLTHWEKLGLVVPGWKGHKDHPEWSKSGAIVPQKVGGEYLMYFLATSPESAHEQMYLARSQDLSHWTPDKLPVLSAREGYWDGILVEPGATPFVDRQGNIHMTYNGDAPPNGYAAGEVVFSGKNPRDVIRRSNTPLLEVTEPFEREGQVGNVIFLEGMTKFKGKVFFYYGAADDKVAVAVSDAPSSAP
jgi:predicted GH43/DUF377 family glycosyl hydrolase